jgi:hypothetical protein
LCPPAQGVLGSFGGREADGLLRELGGCVGRAARGRPRGGALELCGHALVRRLAAERQMTCPALRIGFAGGEALVERPSLLRSELGVDKRGQQRMVEADTIVLDHEKARPHGGVERGALGQHGFDFRKQGLGERGDDRQHAAGLRRHVREPLAEKLVKGLRHWQGGAGMWQLAAPEEGSRQLEPEVRVATGRLVEPAQERARQGGTHALLKNGAECAQRQRAELDAIFGIERTGGAGAAREQLGYGLCAETPERELEHRRGGRVQPLDVVDRDDDRPAPGEHPQRAEERRCDGPAIGPGLPVLAQEKSNLERRSLRCGERREDVADHVRQQVAHR